MSALVSRIILCDMWCWFSLSVFDPCFIRGSSLLTYAQLVRLPNVFTAFADIGLAWAAAYALGIPGSWSGYLLLLAASGCLYMAGMVWNDFFDLEQDRRERPFRPLPSGRVRRQAAAGLGTALLAAGVACAAVAGSASDRTVAGSASDRPVFVASLLAGMVLLYDGVAKRTWLGPFAMGTCRFLNVLLGLSLAQASGVLGPLRWHLALVVGLYIVGVTWFARTEARLSSRPALIGAAAVMLGALVLGLLLPVWLTPGTSSTAFPYLLVGFAFVVGLPVSQAIGQPVPARVQAAVKRAILGLIILDAVLATAFLGLPGLLLLFLLLPASYLGRWIYST